MTETHTPHPHLFAHEELHHAEATPVPVKVVEDANTKQDRANRWVPHTNVIPANTQGNPVMLVSNNPRRKRCVLYTDAGNAGVVFLSAVSSGAPNIQVAAGSSQIIFEHTAAIYGGSVAAATVYSIEESYS